MATPVPVRPVEDVAALETTRERPFNLPRLLLFVVAAVIAILVALPVVWVISQSLTPEKLVYQWPLTPWPRSPTLDNYSTLGQEPDVHILRWFANSIVISGSVTILTLLVASLTGYAFARLEFPGRDLLFYIFLGTLMIPGQATLIPVYLIMRNLHFLNSYQALIFPPLASIFGVFLLRQFFQSVPRELEEAAVVDGCGRFAVYWRIILPVSSSALTALAIFTFLGSWNDLFWPLIVLSDNTMYTLPVGLALLAGEYGGTPGPGLGMAAAMVAAVPTLIFYVIFQRRIVEGVTLTGIKG